MSFLLKLHQNSLSLCLQFENCWSGNRHSYRTLFIINMLIYSLSHTHTHKATLITAQEKARSKITTWKCLLQNFSYNVTFGMSQRNYGPFQSLKLYLSVIYNHFHIPRHIYIYIYIKPTIKRKTTKYNIWQWKYFFPEVLVTLTSTMVLTLTDHDRSSSVTSPSIHIIINNSFFFS